MSSARNNKSLQIAVSGNYINMKIAVAGGMETGKTSVLNRYISDTFDSNHKPTIGIDYKLKSSTGQGRLVKQQIWDLAAQHALVTIVKDAAIFLVVLSAESENALAQLKKWKQQIYLGAYEGDTRNIFVAVNKVDLGIKFNKKELEAYCKKENLQLHYVSAKTGAGINKLFDSMLEKFIEEYTPSPVAAKPTLPVKPVTPRKPVAPIKLVKEEQNFFKSYTDYRFRIFGTHHLKRAEAVNDALNSYDNIEDKLALIENQLHLLDKNNQDFPSKTRFKNIDLKWTAEAPERMYDNINESGFCRKLLELKAQFEKENLSSSPSLNHPL